MDIYCQFFCLSFVHTTVMAYTMQLFHFRCRHRIICVLHHEGIYSICLVPSATGMRPFQRTAPNSFKVATSFAVLTDCTGQCSAMLCAAATPAACPVPMQLAMTRSEANA